MSEVEGGDGLWKDPYLPWSGDFAYERVGERLRQAGQPGIGPASTAREINDALYDLMLAGGDDRARDRRAWDDLHYLDRRLLLDFFMYQGPICPAPGEDDVGPGPVRER
jgi:hypothetical protein